MKAIQYRSYGDYSENRLVELPQPSLNDGEVLVAMRTVGINPLDNTFRSGHYYGATPENLPRIGGQTGAGAVVASKSDAFMVGDRVFVRGPGFGISADGTWREFVAARAASLSHIPDGIDDNHAAAYLAGAGYLTGYLALTEFAKFKPGQSVLAPAIGGAVGMETVQVARRLGASLAISTASSTEKAERAREAGYEHVIDLSREGLKDGVLRITEGKGVDVVVDGVSGKLTGEALASLAFGGTVVIAGYAGGREAEVNVTDIIWKAATIRGFTFRLFAQQTVAAASAALLEFLNDGALQPTIDRVFPLSEAADAVRHLIEDRPFGRVLMRAQHAQRRPVST
ncbi:zinc-binding alcohol dehydrogenase family protein [Bradyrhizobium sp.]|jgi:NADPH:quinone reductase-like Zn-dependent oxidoreductase|uniref:quinone oxidoreductase family protein n=1 Tax=Bradyrhizobium sp. TaxID=376 RepID=UPI002C2469B8|nr:zinc-binding alcohol dehydrogenase family protein [Bradyrhizobium sp.]HWX63301.1 zinc-binding alcohol dehydrogenase family protein [Bradyrhizobium sp.]